MHGDVFWACVALTPVGPFLRWKMRIRDRMKGREMMQRRGTGGPPGEYHQGQEILGSRPPKMIWGPAP